MCENSGSPRALCSDTRMGSTNFIRWQRRQRSRRRKDDRWTGEVGQCRGIGQCGSDRQNMVTIIYIAVWGDGWMGGRSLSVTLPHVAVHAKFWHCAWRQPWRSGLLEDPGPVSVVLKFLQFWIDSRVLTFSRVLILTFFPIEHNASSCILFAYFIYYDPSLVLLSSLIPRDNSLWFADWGHSLPKPLEWRPKGCQPTGFLSD